MLSSGITLSSPASRHAKPEPCVEEHHGGGSPGMTPLARRDDATSRLFGREARAEHRTPPTRRRPPTKLDPPLVGRRSAYGHPDRYDRDARKLREEMIHRLLERLIERRGGLVEEEPAGLARSARPSARRSPLAERHGLPPMPLLVEAAGDGDRRTASTRARRHPDRRPGPPDKLPARCRSAHKASAARASPCRFPAG